MGAFGALGSVGRIRRVSRLALVALVVGDGVGSELVAWVAVRVSVFLGSAVVAISMYLYASFVTTLGRNLRVARTVGATVVLATGAALLRSMEQRRALAASPAHSLTGLLVDQILTARLARPREGDLLVRQVPVGDDGGVLGALLLHGGPLLAALGPLGLGALGRAALAFLAAVVLAVGALLGEPEVVAAFVALAVNPHPDGLLDAQRMALGRMPLARRDLDAKPLAELLGPLLEDLSPRDLDSTLGRPWCLGSLRGRFT